MGIDKEKYVGLIYRDPETMEFSLLYPKTVATQVDIEGMSGVTLQDHIDSDSHLSKLNRALFSKTNEPSGLCKLDENGWVYLENFPEGMLYIKTDRANIDALLADSTTHTNSLVFVYDASGDPTVNEGWAIYVRTKDPDYTSLEKGWVKIAEREVLDLELTWEALKAILPQSSPEAIDDAVANMHEHANKETLDNITVDGEHFAYKGQQVALRKDVTHWIFDDFYFSENIQGNDLWIRSVGSEPWWYDDSVEYAGTTCYQKFAANDQIVSAPRLRTQDVTTFRRMFFQDYNLKEVPKYNFAKALDVSGYLQECNSIEEVPYMNTYHCQNFDHAFSGCSSLKFGPMMYMGEATSAEGMYAGCVNMLEVYEFESTAKLTNMRDMFNGCDSLVSIYSPIDFSSIESASAVANMFNECPELEHLRVVPNTLKVSLSLAGTNLTTESLVSVFRGLVAYEGDPANAPTLNIQDIESFADLTPAEIAIATNKGWKLDDDIVSYEVIDADELVEAAATLSDGETLTIAANIDTSNGKALVLNKKNDVNLEFASDIISDGGNTSGLRITNGSATITGDGLVVTEHPYDAAHSHGVVVIGAGGELTFDGGGISAIIDDDPINRGQFGVVIQRDAKLTVNEGSFEAGWYCVSGNGSTTGPDAVTEINGGTFVSAVDYAFYHPHAGTLIINGGNISGGAGCVAANNGYIEINGGTFSVLGDGDTGKWTDGTGGLGEACLNLAARYGDVTCKITGGTFNVADGASMIVVNTSKHAVNLSISGGRFAVKPNDAWIASGYKCSDEKIDGYYVVSPE